ncbi:hypothetical protein QJS66_08970 [Kocuria rhizophila]|nr:hypothetical protein QJS66_08970 [Kocuria rhizophila]
MLAVGARTPSTAPRTTAGCSASVPRSWGCCATSDRNRFTIFQSLTTLRMLALDPALVDPEGHHGLLQAGRPLRAAPQAAEGAWRRGGVRGFLKIVGPGGWTRPGWPTPTWTAAPGTAPRPSTRSAAGRPRCSW